MRLRFTALFLPGVRSMFHFFQKTLSIIVYLCVGALVIAYLAKNRMPDAVEIEPKLLADPIQEVFEGTSLKLPGLDPPKARKFLRARLFEFITKGSITRFSRGRPMISGDWSFRITTRRG